MENLVIGLDIGTHKICTIVGQVRPDDIFIAGVGLEPSKGMKAGTVTDLQALTTAIAASVHKAEKASGYDIKRAFVSVAGKHISSMNSRGAVGIATNRGVTVEDLDKAMEAARAIAIPHNREVLHVVPRSYALDGQERVRSPLGMHGFRLEVEAHIITASSTSLANIEQAVEGAGVLVDRFILNPLAAADAVLTSQEREMGVVVIDIGGGTTDLAIYIEGTVWHTAVLPVGGYLVSSDITHWMHVPFELAEAVKIQRGQADTRQVDSLETFLVEPFGDGMPIEVKLSELAMVIEARVEEIFDMVHQEIKRSGYDGLIRAGAVITGGGSQLVGTKEVASRTLNMPVRLARPERLTGMADMLRNPAYSTSVGLLRMGLGMTPMSAIEKNVNGAPPIGSNVGRMLRRFLRQLLPDEE